jgi:hypothetical protein
MLEPIQFDRKLCDGTIEVENAISHRMLAPKFESSKTPGPQSTPQLLFLVRLLMTEVTGIAGGIHRSSVNDIFWSDKNKKTPPLPGPLLRSAEEREKILGSLRFRNFERKMSVCEIAEFLTLQPLRSFHLVTLDRPPFRC